MPAHEAIGFILPAAVCWLGSLYCLGWLRLRPWNPAIAAILLAFVARGCASLLGAPRVYYAVDSFVGAANLSRLLINACMIAWSVLILTAIAYWVLPATRARQLTYRWFAAAVLAVVVSAVMWWGVRLPETPESFSEVHAGDDLRVVVFMLIYHGLVAIALLASVVCCVRFARLSQLRTFRIAMWVTVAGAVTYLTFSLHRIVAIVGTVVGWDVGAWRSATPLMTGIGTVLMMTGLTMPMWGPAAVGLTRRRRTAERYAALEPLWRDLRAAVPAISIAATSAGDTGDLDYRLYRRIIDIRDGLLAISAYFPDSGGDSDTGSEVADAAPDRVARDIRDALTTLRSAEHDEPAPGHRREHLASVDRVAEVDWLVAVSRSYVRLLGSTAPVSRSPIRLPLTGSGERERAG
ncbi:hypothetical protein GCM10009624_26050 [Gordonia sinesedis]